MCKTIDTSGHRSVDSLRGYIRDADPFKDHARAVTDGRAPRSRSRPRAYVESVQPASAVVADAKVKERLNELGATAFASTPADFGRFVAAEIDKWRKVIRSANIKPE